MRNYLPLLSIPFFFYCFFQINIEDSTPERIAKNLQFWNNNYPQEKVFLQIDKKQYVAGEEIWFKAWCTFNGKPTFLSRILYIDVVNSKGVTIEKKMLRLDSLASANGSILLDKKIASDNYSINAYTLWMLNFPDYVTRKSFFIYGTDYIKKIKTSIQPQFKINFFPEGGLLIAGVKNRVAFSISDQFGQPYNFSGTINSNNTAASIPFVATHNGMGFFELEPTEKEKFTASLKMPNGAQLTFQLPSVQSEGVNLTIQNTKNRFFALANRGETNKEKYNKLLLVAHIRGQLVYMGEFDFDEGKAAAAIQKKNLPAGIIHFTLFDTTGKPLAERIAFCDNYSIKKPTIQIHEKDLNKRGKNNISFLIDSVNQANMSVLVKSGMIDGTIGLDESIASKFLLTSDIKGNVINPGYYFANKADSTLQNLDLLLMTQGWRKFNWNDVVAQKEMNLKYPIESNINIKGKVTKSDRKEVIKDGKVSFIIRGEDSTKILADAYLTDKGEFILDSLNFRQKASVFYEGQNNKKEKLIVDVHIYPNYIDTLKKSSFTSLENLDTADISNRNNLFTQSIYNQLATVDTLSFGVANLAEVTVRTKKLSKIDSLQREYVSPIFEYSDNTIDFSQAKGMINIWQYLRMQIPGFEVEPFQGGASARFTRFDGAAGISEDIANVGVDGIMFMLNEIQVDAVFIDNILPEDVALVKVYKGNTAFPWGASRGMIAVYTKKGANVQSGYSKAFSKIDMQGYAVNREFFSPNYQKYPDLNKNLTDKRQTLYWNPNLKKDKNGSYQVTFFNNDISKSYKLVIQGIDKNGQLIFAEQIIQ